ncbi:hypothetical protein AVEN_141070-1 [Araneus ventricosus]|uniref:Reverse transcriptase domain-containing protein n=1 Tax=Araneus ventricosus TaxID=182803 RepID=A0A4Y2QST1_ARAVE|nr:hypothetical protein AVEN_141070-1 [Araneus ventricosus]
MESRNITSPNQHVFREGRSIDTAIHSLINRIKDAKRISKHVLVPSIDIKGALENLQHQAIINSIIRKGAPDNIVQIFISPLRNRLVAIQTPRSKVSKEQGKGCPQGSCSGPALWNLVANDILTQHWTAKVFIQAFTDDFGLVIYSNVLSKLKLETQQALHKLKDCTQSNKLQVSPEKTNYILIWKTVASIR